MATKAVQLCAAYVTAGVIISITVAWGCGSWESAARAMNFSTAAPKYWTTTWGRVDGRYGGNMASTRGMTIIYVVSSERIRQEDESGGPIVSKVLPGGKGVGQAVRHVERTTPHGQAFDVVLAFGWPMRCVWARGHDTLGAVAINDDDWAIVPGNRSFVWGQHIGPVLAVRPLWFGLLVNTLLYGVAIAFLHNGILHWRSSRRRRRGLCIRCAYDLTGAGHSKCPECGAKTKTSTASSGVDH